jgi:general secretion pathway protein E
MTQTQIQTQSHPMQSQSQTLLCDALRAYTSIGAEALEQALEKQELTGRRLTDVLLEQGALPERELMVVLGKLYSIPVREELRAEDIDAALATQLPISFAKSYYVLPIRLDGDKLEVAIADPLLTDPLDDLRLLYPASVCLPVLVPRRTIVALINQIYDQANSAERVAGQFSEADLQDLATEAIQEPEDLLDANDEHAPVVRLVNSLLQQAVKARASDIHVEPQDKELVVRFRTDDMLFEPIRPLPKRLQNAVTSRIKIMGKLDIAEKRLPQDGRIALKIAGREYDVRLSTVPTQFGERCVMRLLPRSQELLSLDRIGLHESSQEVLRKLIRRTSGIVLVTGPTGSGKTTTLYAALADINTPEKNIITIQDPVEISLEGISQIEVKAEIGMTFASALRSVLRQDPNVILVGEIRDAETAEIAIQASLTGHLVFSTIHTINSAGAITRLIDMGVEPFKIGSSLTACIAQRLIRTLCHYCREPYEPIDAELEEIELTRAALAGRTVYQAARCERCNYTGYRGRTAIFEMLVIDDEIRKMVTRGIDSKTIERAALRQGMVSMRMYAAQKFIEGETSSSEVLRQTEDERV